jgi:hypothetical protein
MLSDEFEWNDEKAKANFRKHRVSFEDAQRVFDDLGAIHDLDTRINYGEDRMIVIGRVFDLVLAVVYTERGERTRIITARRATRHEEERYYSSQETA